MRLAFGTLWLPLIIVIAICLTLIITGGISMTAFTNAGATGKDIKIGVVDMRRILDESRAAKHIQKQVESERQNLRQEFGNLEQKLKQEKQKLVKEQEQLSQEAFQQKSAQFQQKLEQTRNEAQTKRQKLQQAIANAMDVLREDVKQVVAKMGKSSDYDLVISRQGAVYAADQHDVTDTVLTRLDDKVDEIELEYSAK